MKKENKQISIPSFCEYHRSRLVHGAKFREKDPWMALEVASQIAMLQAIMVSNTFHIKFGGDVEKIQNVGCLACFENKTFKQLVKIAKKNKSIKDIKEFGDSFK